MRAGRDAVTAKVSDTALTVAKLVRRSALFPLPPAPFISGRRRDRPSEYSAEGDVPSQLRYDAGSLGPACKAESGGATIISRKKSSPRADRTRYAQAPRVH